MPTVEYDGSFGREQDDNRPKRFVIASEWLFGRIFSANITEN
jgi:hypothetical protein